jgi:hypothetical protein
VVRHAYGPCIKYGVTNRQRRKNRKPLLCLPFLPSSTSTHFLMRLPLAQHPASFYFSSQVVYYTTISQRALAHPLIWHAHLNVIETLLP